GYTMRSSDGSQARSAILVPLDGSQLAERAVSLAAVIARRTGSELVFLRSVLTAGSLAPNAVDFNRSLLLEARRYLNGMVGRVQAEGLPARFVITEGEAGEGIVRAAV